MLTFVIEGESRYVTAKQFGTLVDVAVRLLRDAGRDIGLDFTVGGLHASTPTIQWLPQPTAPEVDHEEALARVASRLYDGIQVLEADEGLPEWMSEVTARNLYEASDWFEETQIEGITFRAADGRRQKLTRKTYRTLDRVLHEETEAIGSVTGTLITATLTKGPHVTVKDDVHGKGVLGFVGTDQLREAGQWIGEQVTVSGRIKRDFLGRPTEVRSASVELVPERSRRVRVADVAGSFKGPPSVEWLREQRGD